MDYLKQVFLGALKTTWGLVVTSRLSALAISGAILLLSLVIYWRWAGATALTSRVKTVLSGLLGTAVIGILIFVFNVLFLTPKRVYEEQHTKADSLENDLKATRIEAGTLRTDLEHHRHSIATDDPVFPNIIYLLQAFRMFRIELGPTTKCTVYVTAPPESVSIAGVVAQFSIATSNCGTFGPMGTNLPPSILKTIMEGAIPETVIVNASEHDKAADRLTTELSHVFRVERGYKQIPPGQIAQVESKYVWLQFGKGTQFASELRSNQPQIIVRP